MTKTFLKGNPEIETVFDYFKKCGFDAKGLSKNELIETMQKIPMRGELQRLRENGFL